MNALKVVGAIMGKLPDFFAEVSETRFHHLTRSAASHSVLCGFVMSLTANSPSLLLDDAGVSAQLAKGSLRTQE